jgi:hypothetical protein
MNAICVLYTFTPYRFHVQEVISTVPYGYRAGDCSRVGTQVHDDRH